MASLPSTPRAINRSFGMKLVLIILLALFLMIPTIFVSMLVSERADRARSVASEIASVQGGAQTLLGPTLVVPFTEPSGDPIKPLSHGLFYISPSVAKASVKTQVSERHRSLFKVPVYVADLVFDADFDLSSAVADAPSDATLDWWRAEIIVGVGDVRGAQNDATLSVRNARLASAAPAGPVVNVDNLKFTPSLLMGNASLPDNRAMSIIGVPVGLIARGDATFHATAALKLGGASTLSILPYGRSSEVKMTSNWGNPGFVGGFLPVERELGNDGFTASWSVPYIARGVRANAIDGNYIASLLSKELAVNFIELVDPYQSVSRAVKYALMFIGMVFLTFFVFEALSKKRLHPAQYLLIGLAQLVFYLLLLSVAERIGFDWAFLFAATATVSLISLYAYWSFESRQRGGVALCVFAPLYLLIYLLMRLEDQALLIGALCSFAMIAGTMYFTRRIDWSNMPLDYTPPTHDPQEPPRP